MSDNRGFPGTWLEVWIAPGEYIEIKGQDKLVKTWEVVSDVPEQQEENPLYGLRDGSTERTDAIHGSGI